MIPMDRKRCGDPPGFVEKILLAGGNGEGVGNSWAVSIPVISRLNI